MLFGSKLSEFMLEVCPTYTQALRRRRHRKREVAFAASREYVTVHRLKGLNAVLSAIFRVECLISQTY